MGEKLDRARAACLAAVASAGGGRSGGRADVRAVVAVRGLEVGGGEFALYVGAGVGFAVVYGVVLLSLRLFTAGEIASFRSVVEPQIVSLASTTKAAHLHIFGTRVTAFELTICDLRSTLALLPADLLGQAYAEGTLRGVKPRRCWARVVSARARFVRRGGEGRIAPGARLPIISSSSAITWLALISSAPPML